LPVRRGRHAFKTNVSAYLPGSRGPGQTSCCAQRRMQEISLRAGLAYARLNLAILLDVHCLNHYTQIVYWRAFSSRFSGLRAAPMLEFPS